MVCQDVICGAWTNWSEGRYRGWTLTISQNSSLVLTAFLALFITFAASRFWGVVCFVVHQARSSLDDQDDLHHQIQILLRNTTTHTSLISELGRLLWNRINRGTISRSLPILLTTLLYAFAAGLAGLFVPRFIKGTNEVLLKGSTCGWMRDVPRGTNFTLDPAALDATTAILVAGGSSYSTSVAYTRYCYRGQPLQKQLCSHMEKPIINSSVNMNSPCPFRNSICGSVGISVDTGLIAADKDLGINCKEENCISFRRKMECAILQGERYSKGWEFIPGSHSYAPNGDELKSFYFGPSTGVSDPNLTFSISNLSRYYLKDAYNLWFVANFIGNETESNFIPIDELALEDSDVSIIGLSNAAEYLSEVKDPWFNATYHVPDTTLPFFTTDDTIGLTNLACAARYQFCALSGCSPLTGFYKVSPNEEFPLALTSEQRAVYELVWKAAWGTQLPYTIRMLLDRVLLAQDYLLAPTAQSTPLAEDQWKREVWNFHNISLALLQQRITEFASPPAVQVSPGVSSLEFIEPPTSPELLRLCKAVKARSSDYSNFRLPWLVFTIVVGVAVILLDIFLPAIVSWAQRRLHKGTYKSLEWAETSTLQLHRKACEGRDIGPWNDKEGVPSTAVIGMTFSSR